MRYVRLFLRHPETPFRVVLVGVAAFMALTARSYPMQARIFPQFASFLVIGVIGVMYVSEALGMRSVPALKETNDERDQEPRLYGTLRRAMMWLMLFYLAAVVGLGLITGSGLFLLAALRRSGVPWQQAFGLTAVVTAFLYVFFTKFVHITLPEGVLLPFR